MVRFSRFGHVMLFSAGFGLLGPVFHVLLMILVDFEWILVDVDRILMDFDWTLMDFS